MAAAAVANPQHEKGERLLWPVNFVAIVLL